jgi:integrase|tara:strand:- start:252 stop:1304 length:1053 start_codon:yes stop_codon:yes gene_type:complete
MNTTQPRNNMVTSQDKEGGMPVYMKLVDGRWYANIPDPKRPGRKIQSSLNAYANEKRKASVELGKVLQDIDRGIDPTTARKNMAGLKLKGKVSDRAQGIYDTHIIPYFGSMKPKDINEDVLAGYVESRYGLNNEGELQAYGETIGKEFDVLQRLLRGVFGKGHTIDKPYYVNLKRDILHPLTLEQIEHVSKFMNDSYFPVFWIMAYTGMDISDVLDLEPSHFKDGWITKERGKTKIQIKVPICEPLADIFKVVPWPINQESKIFPKLNTKATSTYIRHQFRKAGLSGYGSKYLRRFVGSILLDKGYTKDWIAKALAHAEGSKQTDKYMAVYDLTLSEAFSKIKRVGLEKG